MKNEREDNCYKDELEVYRSQLMDDEDIAFLCGLNVSIIPPPIVTGKQLSSLSFFINY